jgi:hypothetical protein
MKRCDSVAVRGTGAHGFSGNGLKKIGAQVGIRQEGTGGKMRYARVGGALKGGGKSNK